MGVLFNILLFTILNVISFINAQNRFMNREELGIRFSNCCNFVWGFPLKMFRGDFFIEDSFILYYIVINTIIYVFCGFFFGFLFKFIWSKISQRQMELK